MVTLRSEDNILLGPGSLIQSLGTPFLGAGGTIDLVSLDGPDAGGSTITFAGDADAQSY